MIFCSPEPLDEKALHQILVKAEDVDIDVDTISSALEALARKYETPDFAFGLYEIGGGYQFLSKPTYEELVSAFVQIRTKRRISRGVMETLAIVAYKQPVTKQDIEHIRGVQANYALDKLLERELIEIAGRDDSPGRPLRYRTTTRFMDFFGINSLKDLPTLKEHIPDDTPKESHA